MTVQKRKPAPNPETGREQTRRDNSSKQRLNQQRMGVAEDHKTDSMKKGHRGTFP